MYPSDILKSNITWLCVSLDDTCGWYNLYSWTLLLQHRAFVSFSCRLYIVLLNLCCWTLGSLYMSKNRRAGWVVVAFCQNTKCSWNWSITGPSLLFGVHLPAFNVVLPSGRSFHNVVHWGSCTVVIHRPLHHSLGLRYYSICDNSWHLLIHSFLIPTLLGKG